MFDYGQFLEGRQPKERDFDDDRIDNLKVDLEDLIQWFIWIEIDKPGFDLSVENCDHLKV